MKKLIVARFIFISVFIVDTILFIHNNANKYLSMTTENISPVLFIVNLIVESFPFIGLIFLLSIIEKSDDKNVINQIKIYFLLYVILDVLSGLSHFLVNAIQVNYVFFPFYSNKWMFYIIFSLKYLQYQLFLPFILNVIIWIGYIFQFLAINEKILIFEKQSNGKNILIENKKISISFVIGIISSFILLAAFVISGLTFLKPGLYKTGIPLYQVILLTPLTVFFPFSLLTMILSIGGLLIDKKEKIGKIINFVLLSVSVFMVFGLIICMSIFIP